MATAFYNVADPNNAFAVHSTTMIKQELGFWLSVFTPDSVDDDIDEFISSIIATTHYTRTDISQACDVALMLHAMPRLKDYALNTGVLCLRRLHLIYRHTLAVEPELIEPHLINLVTPTSPPPAITDAPNARRPGPQPGTLPRSPSGAQDYRRRGGGTALPRPPERSHHCLRGVTERQSRGHLAGAQGDFR